MKELVQLQKSIYPDLIEQVQQRYSILYTVFLFNLIGRRGIITRKGLPERFVRNEIRLQKQEEFINEGTKGVDITEEGKSIVIALQPFIHELKGLAFLEEKLEEKMLVGKVVVVSGDSETDEVVKQELGRATVNYLKEVIHEDVT